MLPQKFFLAVALTPTGDIIDCCMYPIKGCTIDTIADSDKVLAAAKIHLLEVDDDGGHELLLTAAASVDYIPNELKFVPRPGSAVEALYELTKSKTDE